MSSVGSWLDTIAEFPLPALLGVAALFGVAESGLGVGMFVPGETVVLVLAASIQGNEALVALFVIAGVSNSVGDHIGYLLGYRYGERLRDTALVHRMGVEKWDRATVALRKYGAAAVFLTRVVPVVRTITPAAAGVAKVRYRFFLPASLGGAYTWAAVYVTAGALAGASIGRVEKALGDAGLIVLAVMVVAVVVAVMWRRRRRAESALAPGRGELAHGDGHGQCDEHAAGE
ncbi:MAG: DedA family protein [Saccharomonospora viridis]|jgi:membrane-associated protein|uniref:DedA family protein n=1 Tax=Saccharomonospora viridis TaxID=1852 RepID=UPI00056A4C4B|nr:DedA family protein [Saccharomonospora viridis]SFO85753.1 membrane protein DedA, SNARE-associated domain [Saccharomonospora viridis]